jgi:tRNA 2-thiouridine synthesizing protein A
MLHSSIQTSPADVDWDAGDLACGELVLELRLRMRQLASGQVLRLTARDPGAPADIPAWCRMTGHTLLHTDPATQTYFIQRP